MYKAIKDNKIIAINETGEFPCLVYDKVIKDNEHLVSDYEQYHCEFLLKGNIHYTKEEQREKRASAYVFNGVDKLMTEYTRKKTFNLFKDGEEETLLKSIEEKVANIKKLYPYPIEE